MTSFEKFLGNTLRAVIFADRNFRGWQVQKLSFAELIFAIGLFIVNFAEFIFAMDRSKRSQSGWLGWCTVYNEPRSIQSRKRVAESILGETSTCIELENNFYNKKPKIGQVKDIRA